MQDLALFCLTNPRDERPKRVVFFFGLSQCEIGQELGASSECRGIASEFGLELGKKVDGHLVCVVEVIAEVEDGEKYLLELLA